MAQSKKELLKRIRRQFAEVSRTMTTAPLDILILEYHKQLRLDIRETSQKIRGVSSADLRSVASPVTFQDIDRLSIRVRALIWRLDPARHAYDVPCAGLL